MFDVIIIGGGPAGLTAAIYTARAGLSARVLEKLSPGGQAAATFRIENYPGFRNISGMDLANDLAEHARAAGAGIVMEEATGLELSGDIKRIRTGTGQYEAKAVVLALGSRYRKLEVPGEAELTGHGVSYCATCDGNFFRDRDVAVVGGGNTAVGDAVQLAKICRHVILIHRRDELRADYTLRRQLAALPNVTVRYGEQVEEILGSQRVERLRLKGRESGEIHDVDVSGIFVAIGMQPNSEIIREDILLPGGFVRADENGVTALPGVFAAGDLREKRLHQIVTALSDGANAAYSAQLYLQGRAAPAV